MNNPTETIYNCLTESFWTNRHCRNCQQSFTKADYQNGNYYLTFWELEIRRPSGFTTFPSTACLDGVIVHLFHHHCELIHPYPLKECSAETILDTTNDYE